LNALEKENPSYPPFTKGRDFPLFGKEGPGEISHPCPDYFETIRNMARANQPAQPQKRRPAKYTT
jgi:hypothetical protein